MKSLIASIMLYRLTPNTVSDYKKPVPDFKMESLTQYKQ